MRKSTVLFTIVIGVLLALVIPNHASVKGGQDFLIYWAASHLLANGENPYNSEALRQLEKEVNPDLQDGDVVEAWNPPWLLLVLLPLGILPFKWAIQLWIFLNVVLIVLSLHLAWRICLAKAHQEYFALALGAGFLFGSTIMNLRIGQVSAILLISLMMGTWLIRENHDFWAGAVFLLATFKPHITYLALAFIFLWALRMRRWKIFAGLASAVLVSFLLAWLLYPGWLEAYLETIFRLPYNELYTSTLGSLIEVIFGVRIFRYVAILLLPVVFIMARAAGSDIRNENWFTLLNLSLLISQPLSPYGFSFDHIVLLPAIVQMIAWILKREIGRSAVWIIVLGLTVTYGLMLWMMTLYIPYSWFAWIPLALLIIFLFAWRQRREPIPVH